MKEQLQSLPSFLGLCARGTCYSMCIFFLIICGAAQSQPTMISNISTGSKNFIAIDGALYYSVGGDLYKATPSTAPVVVSNTGENIIAIYNIRLGNYFFFVTQTSSGRSLWRSDGTSANTAMITVATQITPLLVYQSELYVRINAAATGTELWKVNSSFNASIVKDINPGAASGYIGYDSTSIAVHNGFLYFIANAGSGQDIWRSNGTTAGTVLAADIDDTEVYNPSDFSGMTSYNNALYFTRNHEDQEYGDRIAELWKSDGTTEGTSILVTYGGGNYWNYIKDFTVFKGKLYFFHGTGDPPYVWFSVTDGTASGTQHLELVTIDGDARAMTNAEDYLLYHSDSQSFPNPIMKFDGTNTSEINQFSIADYSSEEYVDLTYTGGRAFFVASVDRYDYPQSERQLWQADLDSDGSRPVAEIYDSSYHKTRNITAVDGSIYFTREISDQLTLWYYNPDSSPTTCEGTGNILQEIWTNVSGTDVRTFDFTTTPTGGTRSFTSFETTQYYANNYASRMRSVLCVPQSGTYTFWISSDDQSELYLSTSPYEADMRLIAWVYGYTPFRKYDKYPSQKSAQIYLQAGRKYYIEARHKEGNGNDFISVGWTLPDGTVQQPIPGDRLTAITTPPNEPPLITINSPEEGQSFPAYSSVTIAADIVDPDGVSYVGFTHVYSNGSRGLAGFESPPYQYQWNNLAPGAYTVKITAKDSKNAEAIAYVSFTVEEAPCEGTGTVVREIWRNIPGTSISSIPVNSPPTNTQTLTSLATQNYYANDYGSRIRGYICAPATGNFVMYISGDDTAELWVSTDDQPANKQDVASVPGATRVGQYNKWITQFGDVYMEQGHRYYFEVLHKEANGADHVEVGWEWPGGSNSEFPIQGSHLIPFEDASASAARFGAEEIFSMEEEATFSVSPNPAISGRQVSIKLPIITEGDVSVDIKSITGASVQSEMLPGTGGELLIDLKPSVVTGMYLIRVSNQKGRWSTKLQVK
jgi:ELWxxDGT repeat protein